MPSPHRRVSELPALNALMGTELFYCAQNGFDRSVTASVLTGSASVNDGVITLTDGVTVPINASLGNVFQLTALGNRTILTPTGAPAGSVSRKMTIRHTASGANRTLTLATGVAGAFRFGTTVTVLSATLSGTTDYIGCLWNSIDSRWDVVAYSKGF